MGRRRAESNSDAPRSGVQTCRLGTAPPLVALAVRRDGEHSSSLLTATPAVADPTCSYHYLNPQPKINGERCPMKLKTHIFEDSPLTLFRVLRTSPADSRRLPTRVRATPPKGNQTSPRPLVRCETGMQLLVTTRRARPVISVIALRSFPMRAPSATSTRLQSAYHLVIASRTYGAATSVHPKCPTSRGAIGIQRCKQRCKCYDGRLRVRSKDLGVIRGEARGCGKLSKGCYESGVL